MCQSAQVYGSPNHLQSQAQLPDQFQFGQRDPVHFCPRRHEAAFIGCDSQGKPFRIRHRDPRCSRECHDAWSQQECHCVTEYIARHMPKDATVFRSHMHMPKGSCVSDHAATRTKFMHALRRLRDKLKPTHKNLVLEIRCYTHCTSPDEQHYDPIVYSNIPQDELRQHLRRLWTNAGGRADIALVLVEEGDLIDAVGYLSKSQHRHRTRFYLPAYNGLDHVWGSQFFVSKSKVKLWEELRQKLHPTPPAPTRCAPTMPEPTLQRRLVDALDELIGGTPEERHRDHIDSLCILHTLGSNPADGLSLSTIAHRSGTPIHRVQKLLPTISTARSIPRWKDSEGKVWSNSGFFEDASTATPDEWQSLSDYSRDICDLVGMDYISMFRRVAATEFNNPTSKGGS